MMRKIFLLVLSVIVLNMMSACNQNDYIDLEAFVHSSGDGLQGRLIHCRRSGHTSSLLIRRLI